MWGSVVNFWKQKRICEQEGLWNTGLVWFYAATEGWLARAYTSWVPPAGRNEQAAVALHPACVSHSSAGFHLQDAMNRQQWHLTHPAVSHSSAKASCWINICFTACQTKHNGLGELWMNATVRELSYRHVPWLRWRMYELKCVCMYVREYVCIWSIWTVPYV